eukprot:TRINITY_DN7819_c0_g1_i1.p1 TRINITY_DN7819_c0_g1~~TRINITY_DN7819_c0_g1_i1.p1  ORF type:complete len:276 (-),score=61.10 TRINITY_DN7819_c0_g1_i1:129-914(-)
MTEIAKTIEDWKLKKASFERQSKAHSERINAPLYQLDSSVSSCAHCKEHFSLVKRKHHCKGCGAVFCSNCSNQKIKLPNNMNQEVRVCKPCYDLRMKRLRAQNEVYQNERKAKEESEGKDPRHKEYERIKSIEIERVKSMSIPRMERSATLEFGIPIKDEAQPKDKSPIVENTASPLSGRKPSMDSVKPSLQPIVEKPMPEVKKEVMAEKQDTSKEIEDQLRAFMGEGFNDEPEVKPSPNQLRSKLRGLDFDGELQKLNLR